MAPFTSPRARCRRRPPPTSACGASARARGAVPGARRLRRPRHRRRLLATGLTLDRRIRLFIDVGTNCEIVLGSSARGARHRRTRRPCVRGGADPLRHARRRRAIEGVKIVDGEVELTVIGDVAPVGLCGSGLVDAVAELVGAGMLDRSGRFVARSLGPLREDRRGERLLPLRRRLPLAARRARAPVREGVDRDRLEPPLPRPRDRAGGDLAGAARRLVRLVPVRRERGQDRARAELPLARIVSAGNVAGEGAKIAALSVTSAPRRTRSSTRSSTSSSPAGPTSTTFHRPADASRHERAT